MAPNHDLTSVMLLGAHNVVDELCSWLDAIICGRRPRKLTSLMSGEFSISLRGWCSQQLKALLWYLLRMYYLRM